MDRNTERSKKTSVFLVAVAETGPFNVAQAGLNVTEIPLPQPFECRDTGMIYQTIPKGSKPMFCKKIGKSLISVIRASEDGLERWLSG